MPYRSWYQRRLGRRTFLKGIGVGVGSIAAGGSFLGCGSSGSQSSTAKDAGGGTQAARKGGTLTMAYRENPTNLDPFTTRFAPDKHWQFALFNTLVGQDKSLAPIPELAESWTVVDPKTIDFKLRRGVKFHDGTDFDAKVVKYNIERHLDPKTGSYARGSLISVAGVEIIDDFTARLHMNKPSASIFSSLAEKGGMMCSPQAVEKWGQDFSRHPVGTGPFEFVEWLHDSHVTLKRFDGYWEKDRPYLDGLRYEVIPDQSVQVTNISTGKIDLMIPEPKDVAPLRADPNVVFMEEMGLGYDGLNINISQPPFTNVNVRRALAWSVDRDVILKGIFFNQGKIAYGPFTDVTWAHDPNVPVPKTDLNKAREFLRAAGMPDGFKVKFLATPTETNTAKTEMLQSQWRKIGVDIEIVMRNNETAAIEYREQKYPFFLTGFTGRADPDQNVAENYHTKGGFNRASFNPNYKTENPELDRMIEEAGSIYDINERKKLYSKIENIIINDAYGIQWRQNPNQVGITKRVQNLVQYGDGIMRFKDVWLKA